MSTTTDPYSPADCRLALDRSVPIPLWAQIEDYLAGAITEQVLAPGATLGSEHELATRFAVSRMTVRQALTRLAQRELITRRRTDGTRVAG